MIDDSPTPVYMSPEQVCDLIPGMTKGNLAQLRYNGGGPMYLKVTPRVIVYRRDVVLAWLDSKQHTRTDRPIR